MATVIKKISELEQLTELSSSSNVIIEENGKAKRFAANNIGGKVKTVNGVEPDENGNIEIEIEVGSEQVQVDWSQNDSTQPDYVKNRTHYEENSQTVIEWDGNTEGRDIFDAEGTPYYKVSDLAPTKCDLIGGQMIVDSSAVEISEDTMFDDNSCLMNVYGFLVIYDTSFSLYGTEYTVNSCGTYFLGDGPLSSLTYGSTTVYQLDEKFIPDTVARKADVTWENLPDKPFYDEQTVVEWDGNTEDRDSFEMEGMTFYKVSDLMPNSADVVNGTVEDLDGDTLSSYQLQEDYVLIGDGCFMCGETVMVVQKTECSVAEISITAPSIGVYFASTMVGETLVRASKLTYGSIKTIDEKFIPDTIARVADIFPMPETAEVGQFIMVSAVDENGVVTATEAVTLADAEEVAF